MQRAQPSARQLGAHVGLVLGCERSVAALAAAVCGAEVVAVVAPAAAASPSTAAAAPAPSAAPSAAAPACAEVNSGKGPRPQPCSVQYLARCDGVRLTTPSSYTPASGVPGAQRCLLATSTERHAIATVSAAAVTAAALPAHCSCLWRSARPLAAVSLVLPGACHAHVP